MATQKYARDIYTGVSPGLFRLNHLGYYGIYRKCEVIYADLGELFGFVIFQNPDVYDDYIFEPVYDSSGGLLLDVVQMYKYDIFVKSEINIREVK